jgi:hypothetical protein
MNATHSVVDVSHSHSLQPQSRTPTSVGFCSSRVCTPVLPALGLIYCLQSSLGRPFHITNSWAFILYLSTYRRKLGALCRTDVVDASFSDASHLFFFDSIAFAFSHVAQTRPSWQDNMQACVCFWLQLPPTNKNYSHLFFCFVHFQDPNPS